MYFLSYTFYNLQDLDDMNIEIMRNTLYKAYLEDFYRFCQVRMNGDWQVFCMSLWIFYTQILSVPSKRNTMSL